MRAGYEKYGNLVGNGFFDKRYGNGGRGMGLELLYAFRLE